MVFSLFRKKKQAPAQPQAYTAKPLPQPPRIASLTPTSNESTPMDSLLDVYNTSSEMVSRASAQNLVAQSSAALPLAPAPEKPALNIETALVPPTPRNISGVSSPSSPLSRHSSASTHRLTPSYMRQTRALSVSMSHGLGPMFTPLQSLRHRLGKIITDLPQQLLPIVNLLNAQKLRTYAQGPLSVLTENGLAWIAADATLTGTELAIWPADAANPRYLNVQDCIIVPSVHPVAQGSALYDLHILQDYDLRLTTLRFDNTESMHMWFAALQIARFEHTALNEVFTGVLLALKGPNFSDIFTLLDHKKRFSRFEWCNLRLPQVSNKWVRVFIAIIPGDAKKTGRVEMYTSDKITKKNLVLYVNAADSVYNVFPEDHRVIDVNLIMKLEGQVFVNKLFEHLFSHEGAAGANPQSPLSPRNSLLSPVMSKSHSRRGSASSMGSITQPAGPMAIRSRSTSISSSSSFFVNAPSPNPELKLDARPYRSNHFFKKQAVNNFVETNYLYLMPEPHPGVTAVEIMLRNFMHIIDAFKLYGRPERLCSEKTNMALLLFGMPALPHYGYLSNEDARVVTETNFQTARLENWGTREWRHCFKQYVAQKHSESDFSGYGDIYELFDSFENDSSESLLPSRLDSRPSSPPAMHNLAQLQQERDATTSPVANGLDKPIQLRREPAQRSLHPIVDIPTPLEDMPTYFGARNQPVSAAI